MIFRPKTEDEIEEILEKNKFAFIYFYGKNAPTSMKHEKCFENLSKEFPDVAFVLLSLDINVLR